MKNIILLIVAVFSHYACVSSDAEIHKEELNQSPTAVKNSILIQDNKGQNLGYINISNHNEFALNFAQLELIGTLKNEKRHYSKNGKVLGTIKYNKEDALKLKGIDENLIWKVKFKEDKIKFQKKEEAAEAMYTLKIKDNKIKVLKGEEQEIGMLILEEEVLLVQGPTQSYTIKYNKLTPAFAVLLMDDFSNLEKATLMAEILAKG